jgi:hypothetical protein
MNRWWKVMGDSSVSWCCFMRDTISDVHTNLRISHDIQIYATPIKKLLTSR